METTSIRNTSIWVRGIGLALFMLGGLLAGLSALGFHGFLRTETFVQALAAFLIVAGLRSFLYQDDDETPTNPKDTIPPSRTLTPGTRLMARRLLHSKAKLG